VAQIIRKAALPSSCEVPESVRSAAAAAAKIVLREPRPAGFPLLFSAELALIEPAIAFLHEHGVQRAHTPDTVRTYAEILYDWFDTLEQNDVDWATADAADLIAYRNRMLAEPSPHTQRAYSIRTINHRVRGVLRFYAWAVRSGWLRESTLVGRGNDFAVTRRAPGSRRASAHEDDMDLFVLRQYAELPRPLTTAQIRELLAALMPPYDLMARWQLYTGLRVSELLRLTVAGLPKAAVAAARRQRSHQSIDVMRKGRKSGSVIAPATLLDETAVYLATHRRAWLARTARGREAAPTALFINSRGRAVSQNHYQQVIHRAGLACGFRATTHLLRATFACMMLARLEQLAGKDTAVNPLLIVKVLMAHEHIETTDRYLRAIAVDHAELGEVLESLLEGAQR
jgi:site-specific recombinase XerD